MIFAVSDVSLLARL